MKEFLASLCDTVVDRTADELVGAIMIALILALAVTGLYALGRRKVGDGLGLVVGLACAANLASMALAVGYLARSRGDDRRDGSVVRAAEPPNRHGPRPELDLARRIFAVADEDRDGFLSAEEATAAAALFVQSADDGGKGRLDTERLSEMMRSALFRPHAVHPLVRSVPQPPPGDPASGRPIR